MSVRDVSDEHCSDVVDALALVTSLAIDPNAAVTAVIPPVHRHHRGRRSRSISLYRRIRRQR
jgi:hypothetical protein